MPSEYTVQEIAKNVQVTHLFGTITTNSCPQKYGRIKESINVERKEFSKTLSKNDEQIGSKVSVATRTALRIPLVIVSATRTSAHNFLPRIQIPFKSIQLEFNSIDPFLPAKSTCYS